MKVLDHGFIELVTHWGSDEQIIEAARESTDKGFLGWGPKHEEHCAKVTASGDCDHFPTAAIVFAETACTCEPKPGDEKLLKFLWTNKHSTPFEFAGLVVRVQAPIFVFREWHRHRTQSYSEISARYTPLPDVNYVPSIERTMLNVGTANKQAGAIANAYELTEHTSMLFQEAISQHYAKAEALYQESLQAGVPKELARIVLPVGRYSRMRATANLLNWLKFIGLRSAPNAQWEIRQFSDALASIVKEKFPRTYEVVREGLGLP